MDIATLILTICAVFISLVLGIVTPIWNKNQKAKEAASNRLLNAVEKIGDKVQKNTTDIKELQTEVKHLTKRL